MPMDIPAIWRFSTLLVNVWSLDFASWIAEICHAWKKTPVKTVIIDGILFETAYIPFAEDPHTNKIT